MTSGKRPDGGAWVRVWYGISRARTLTQLAISTKPKKQAGAAANLATYKKHAKYSNIKTKGMGLVVVAVETSVVWREKGRRWIYTIGRKLIEKPGENKAKSHLIH